MLPPYVSNPPVIPKRGRSVGVLVISHCPTSLLHSERLISLDFCFNNSFE